VPEHPFRRPAGELITIGWVESVLTDPTVAPKQGREGAPPASLVVLPDYVEGLADVSAGDHLLVLTWLDLARRDTLRVHPRDDPASPLCGVFSTRSADRPNPIGLHPVHVTAVEGNRITVDQLEAIHGTPILDLKPALPADGAA
jgi:tRNA-Thr(GGU) m(6)t(6)A37 methyltransferase TsaA